MNKEVKELIEEIEFIRDTFADGVFIDLLNEILNYITNTEQKVNQLETNRDEAIEYIQEYKFATTGFYMHRDKLLSILERGKE